MGSSDGALVLIVTLSISLTVKWAEVLTFETGSMRWGGRRPTGTQTRLLPGIPSPLLALPRPLTGCVCSCGRSPREGRDFPFPHCSTQIFFS